MRQHLRNFDNWKLNESYDMGAAPSESDDIVKRLIAEVDKAVALENWIEANRTLRDFVKDNEQELAKADGTEVLTALEPWYDTYNKDWESDAAEFSEEDPLSKSDEFEFDDEAETGGGDIDHSAPEGGADDAPSDDDWE